MNELRNSAMVKWLNGDVPICQFANVQMGGALPWITGIKAQWYYKDGYLKVTCYAYCHPINDTSGKNYLYNRNNRMTKCKGFILILLFSVVFAREFDEVTLLHFERVKLGQVICVFSDLTKLNY